MGARPVPDTLAAPTATSPRRADIEIKIEDGTFALSGVHTPQELLQALHAIADTLTKATGNRTDTTDEPLLFGSGRVDVRLDGPAVQLSIHDPAGWLALRLLPIQACQLAAQVCALNGQLLSGLLAQHEVARDAPTVQ